MQLTFEVQSVVFEFDVDNVVRLGRVLDCLQEFARGVDRVNRQPDASPQNERPLVTFQLLAQADRARLNGVYIKSRTPISETIYKLEWDRENKCYIALADSQQ